MDTLQKKKQLILIVDDAPRNIQVIGTILRKKGFLVSIAQSGSQALNIIEAWLNNEFEGDRHQRRLDKIEEM